MGLFNNRKKSMWDTINGMPGDEAMRGTPPIFDPNEAQQEYDPSGQASAGPDAKPKFFGDGGVGRGIAGSIGDFLLAQAHMSPVYAPAMEHRRDISEQSQQYQQQRKDTMDDWTARQQYEEQHRPPAAPVIRENGPDMVSYDPNTGKSDVVYQGKPEYSRYAESLGLKPGTPEFNRAQQDYVLRGIGPTGFNQQQQLIGQRVAGQQAVKGMPTYTQAHPQAGGGGGGSGGGGRGVTPTARAKYISEAQIAISRGADPAKVHARLRQMGIE